MSGITAIIPVKGKSSRIPNKSILPFANSNLLINKIRQLKLVGEVNKIVVSSEDDVLLKMAENEGVTALKRPEKYVDDSLPFGEFVSYICSQVIGDHILLAFATSPLVEPLLYEKAIKIYLENLGQGYDSLITVQEHQHYLLDQIGTVNFHRGLGQKISQDLPILYVLTNGIFLAPRKSMIEWKYHWGYNPYRLVVDKRAGVDIDDRYDYEFAKLLYNMD